MSTLKDVSVMNWPKSLTLLRNSKSSAFSYFLSRPTITMDGFFCFRVKRDFGLLLEEPLEDCGRAFSIKPLKAGIFLVAKETNVFPLPSDDVEKRGIEFANAISPISDFDRGGVWPLSGLIRKVDLGGGVRIFDHEVLLVIELVLVRGCAAGWGLGAKAGALTVDVGGIDTIGTE